jgi:putative ABC transport system ATP-binding protein
VLKDANLSIDKGEMVAIKGSSGAGKSTLLHIIGCLDKPTSGSYLLNGQDVSQLSLSKLAEIRNASFGFVMQHFALIEEDNALQNVATPLLFAKARRSQMDARAMEQLRNVGMEQMANKRIATLSGGEKQRVAIARAMVNNPEIILADEPTGALDRANTEKIVQLFQQLNEKGKTIIIVTHDDFVAQSCRRIVTIADGVIKST